MAAPEDNTNAEIWTFEKSKELFDKSKEMSKDDQYDFIGEIARDLGISRNTYTYLVKKFTEFESDLEIILGNLEANCFKHSKTGKIREASAIMNLKSNYQWTDRKEIKHEVSQGFLNVDPLADDPPNASPQKVSEA